MSQLGIQFYNGENNDKNLSWESLYNSNHTPKNNPSWEAGALSVINYGPNVNRDNLNMNYNISGEATSYGEKTGLIGAFSRRSLEGRNEPYVVSDIGDDSKTRGGRFNPNRRANADGDRITQFLASEEGVAFIARQNTNLLIENTVIKDGDELKRVPQRFNTFFNPLNTIAAQHSRLIGQGVPNALFKTGEIPIIDDIFSTSEYPNSAPEIKFSINDTFTGGSIEGSGNLISQLIDAAFSFIPGVGTTKTKVTAGDIMTLAPMIKGNNLNELVDEIYSGLEDSSEDFLQEDITNDEKYGMPFYFKDMRDNTYVFFRAYIEGLSENISPSYASHNYVGRSEPVYTYERAEREISMTLKLAAQTKDELVKIYEKMDRLTSMCYPQYVDEGETGYGNRMKPPLAKLRYGELFGKQDKELMGYIKSISYSIESSATYETEVGKRVPKHVIATIGYQVIHDKAPRLGTKFYGINK